MDENNYSDRRIFERLPIKLSLKYLDLRSNRENTVETQDISAKGLGLVTNEELKPFTPLEIWLNMPDRGEPLYTRGEVVWSSRVTPGQFRAGVRLEKAELMGLSRALRDI